MAALKTPDNKDLALLIGHEPCVSSVRAYLANDSGHTLILNAAQPLEGTMLTLRPGFAAFYFEDKGIVGFGEVPLIKICDFMVNVLYGIKRQ